MAQRHFNAPVDRIEGTVKSASAEGVELAEYPGRVFRFSSVGSMVNMTRSLPSPRIHISRARGRRDRHSAQRDRMFAQTACAACRSCLPGRTGLDAGHATSIGESGCRNGGT